jgi:hypothetical protein
VHLVFVIAYVDCGNYGIVVGTGGKKDAQGLRQALLRTLSWQK